MLPGATSSWTDIVTVREPAGHFTPPSRYRMVTAFEVSSELRVLRFTTSSWRNTTGTIKFKSGYAIF